MNALVAQACITTCSECQKTACQLYMIRLRIWGKEARWLVFAGFAAIDATD